MGLKNLHLEKAYSSDFDDILYEFYIPTLKESMGYDRLAGFFSSTSLAIAAKGILGLIKNEGTMRLIVSPKLEKNDLEIILNSYKVPEKYIEKRMLEELERLENAFVRDHVFALGWMIANKKLKMKVAVAYGDEGKPLSYKDIQQSGLFHQKVGILRDSRGNTITFSGSINETATGWLENIEEFKVFRSWDPSEKDYVEADVSKFNRFWSDQSERVKILDIPRAVEKKFIEIAPASIERIDLQKWYKKSWRRKRVELYLHQRDAVRAWLRNGKKGIFEMATGTGKTFTALRCLDRVSKSTQRLLTVVACPYQHLVQQWKREIDKFGIRYDGLIIADSSNPGWRDALTDSMIDLTIGYKKRLLILTTHQTFSSDSFRSIVMDNKRRFSAFVIGDEVHGLGAEKRQEGLIDEYDLRLGLSATPKRWFDTPGTRTIYDYFGGIVYEFDLRRAINRINPATGQTYLTPFRYIPRFVSLSPEELEEYAKQTRAIGLRFNQAEDEDVKDNLLERLLFKRANIIKNAQAKYEVLDDLLDKISSLKWTIIYCSPQQIDAVMAIMNRRRIVAHRFTMEEGTTSDKKYNGLSERQFLLEKFAEGKYQVLVAMRCLDEGVDVPPARTAILMASSGNPRQYVQRIGRVIRRYPGKTEASIHDIIVTPSLGPLSSAVADAEWAIFKKELERYEDIARVAINSAEALKLVYAVKSKVMEAKQ